MSLPPDSPLSIETIRAHLNTREIGATLSVHEEVDSTNRILADLARAGASHGAVVVAESQTAGRGRLGRAWVSPRGVNLYASILLTTTQASSAITWIPLLAAVAVVRAITTLAGLSLRVKWPNDVLVPRDGGDRKLAGILVEGISSGQAGAKAVVVGIGINVNMPSEAFPEDLRSSATSLLIETGHPVERAPLLAALLGELERLHNQLRDQGTDGIAAAYRSLCDTLGKQVRIELAGSGPIKGTAEGLAPDGALRLRTREGKILEIRAGDVVHLR
ncbi:MAG: biotin--[acetyl-CoA-carboxylase] ligase [Nitrospirae bacterium]|nr:biotin--[acetyl-CoA-carboxylase] ligase [Nitrospirota bacterium]